MCKKADWDNRPQDIILPHIRWHSTCTRQTAMLSGVGNHLERYLDLLTARQKLVAANIANADTPGYQAKDIDFQFEYQSLAQGLQPQPINTPGLVTRPDGNNVDLDREARLLAENAMRFNLATTLLRGDLRMVQSAINEGK
jgi:flagellar basal-body rod protein FlgB